MNSPKPSLSEELLDEARWSAAFANSQGELRVLAAEALQEHRAGKTKHMQIPKDRRLNIESSQQTTNLR